MTITTTITQAAGHALQLCDRIAAETDVPGTITRLFLSPATRSVHAMLLREMDALGMHTRIDAAGNVRGILRSANGNAPTLLLGSHIDTVPDAGRYDGILGVAMPLALLALPGARNLPYNVEVIAFSEEEGVRFRAPFLGSRALVGSMTSDLLARQDDAGITVAQALDSFGLAHAADAALTPGTFAFIEVHIEQGPVLEALGIPLGVVETIVGQTRLALTFTGQANHAGTTPMRFRRDPLAAAAAFISRVETLALEQDLRTPGLVATIGAIDAHPGAPNIIPGRVTLSLDVRHPDDCTRLRFRRALTAEARGLAAGRAVELRIRQTSQQDSVAMDPKLTRALSAAVSAAGHTPHVMASGAGHDAMIVAGRVPSAMLFLRSPGGLSHHPNEAVLSADVEAALASLLLFLERLPHALS